MGLLSVSPDFIFRDLSGGETDFLNESHGSEPNSAFQMWYSGILADNHSLIASASHAGMARINTDKSSITGSAREVF